MCIRDRFQPNTQITRAEFAQMVVGAMYVDTASTDTSALRKRFKDWASIPVSYTHLGRKMSAIFLWGIQLMRMKSMWVFFSKIP